MGAAEGKTEGQVKLGSSGGRAGWAILSALLLAHIFLATLQFDPKPFVGGDNAGYMILAEALESGRGYRDVYLPGEPLHAQYPPVYPALLAVTGALGGGLTLFKVLSAVFTTSSLVFLFGLARRRLGWEVGLAVLAPFAVNPVLVYYSHWVLSEAPFVLLTLVALWAAERMTNSSRWLAVAVSGAVLAYLTRAAGLPLLAALVLSIAWRRRWRQLALAGAPIVIAVAGWWLWGRLAARESARVYSNNFLLVDPYSPSLGYVGPAELFARVVNNIRLYCVQVMPESLAGVAPGGGISLVALLVALLVLALAVVGWLSQIRKMRALELYTILYAALIFLWPQVWTDRRFLLPLLPVLFLHSAGGLSWCFEFLRRRRPEWALPVLSGVLIALTIPHHIQTIGFNQSCLRVYRQGDELACYPPPWRAFVQAAHWVRDNTPEDAIVVSRKPRLFYYWSGRRGDVYPFTQEEDEMFAFLDSIHTDYVVVAGLSGTTARYLIPVIRSMPERFDLIFTVGQGPAAAYVLAYRSSP
ncbi:MAG: glycosyltransferase family 39 protein [Gemmatimonadota bacterium]|nr:MAG: glycosyltransferase family 39 protein [Gemmatimonadota bacterium]